MLVGDLLERLGADLLFAFDQEAQRDRQLTQLLERLERVDSRHHVRLVVGDSARDDPPILLNRFERLGVPQLDRVHGLNVVVLVQQQLATARSGHLGVQGGHPPRLQRLDPVRVAGQALRQPVAGRLDRLAPWLEMLGKEHSSFSSSTNLRLFFSMYASTALVEITVPLFHPRNLVV